MGSELGPATRKEKRQDEVDDVQLCEIGRRAIVKDGFPPGPRESLSNRRTFLSRLIATTWTSANAVFLSTRGRWSRLTLFFFPPSFLDPLSANTQGERERERERERDHGEKLPDPYSTRQLPNLSAGSRDAWRSLQTRSTSFFPRMGNGWPISQTLGLVVYANRTRDCPELEFFAFAN